MKAVRRWVQLSIALCVFWLVLAMPLDVFDVLWGLAVAGLAGLGASFFLWRRQAPGLGARNLAGLMFHGFDLVRLIVPAALQVARVVLDPSLPVRPKIIVHKTALRGELERVTLANTITLTPGTHCVDLDGDQITVHCLAPSFADALVDGRIERRILRSLGISRADG